MEHLLGICRILISVRSQLVAERFGRPAGLSAQLKFQHIKCIRIVRFNKRILDSHCLMEWIQMLDLQHSVGSFVAPGGQSPQRSGVVPIPHDLVASCSPTVVWCSARFDFGALAACHQSRPFWTPA